MGAGDELPLDGGGEASGEDKAVSPSGARVVVGDTGATESDGATRLMGRGPVDVSGAGWWSAAASRSSAMVAASPKLKQESLAHAARNGNVHLSSRLPPSFALSEGVAPVS